MLYVVIILQATLLLFVSSKKSLAASDHGWDKVRRFHEVAVDNPGQTICYNLSDTNHYVDGWYCIEYWGKSDKDIPNGGGSDDDEQYAGAE